MTREEVMKTLNEIFCNVFDDDTIVLTDKTNANDIEDWDSLEQINLIVNIENEFGMMFDMAEVSDLANVGEMNEYRFEDLYIGKEEYFSVTVTEEMMKMFLELSGDSNPLHNNQDFAISQGYQSKVVYGLLTTSFISRLVGVLLPGKYCLLQGIDVKYSKPVYVGDILIVKGVVDELHESVKRAVIKVTIQNQDEKKVVKGKAEVGFLK